MTQYNSYITTKRFVGEAICGKLSIPYGAKLSKADGFIVCEHGRICAVTSQNAYEHFSQDDDGHGLERGKLVQDILHRLRRLKQTDSRYQHVWDRIWADERCRKYKRPEHADYWLWSYEFYNASIEDLKYIRNLIMKG